MKNSEILAHLDLGSSVAENDQNLGNYFVPTVALNDFVSDRYDLIRGVKGSGKSAILRIVSTRQGDYPQISDVLLNVATEHAGEPAFKRAFDTLHAGGYTEGGLINAWKTYLINLALDVVDDLPESDETRRAITFAEKSGLRYRTESSFKKVWWSLLRVLHIKSFTVGVDNVAAEFPDAPPEIWTKSEEIIDFPTALGLCVRALAVQ